MRYSSDELYYEQVTVLGYTALFTNERIKWIQYRMDGICMR